MADGDHWVGLQEPAGAHMLEAMSTHLPHGLECVRGRLCGREWCGLVLAGMLLAVAGRAEEARPFAVGVRSGFASSDPTHAMWQVEAFLNRDLPWQWDLGKGWRLGSRLELTSGFLERYDQYGYVGTLGPSLMLRYRPWPLVLDIGSRPTVLSQEEFGDRDFALWFQVTTHGGLDWEVSSRWRLGYRFQHMSNAGLATPNPGVNMHLVGIGYRF